MAGKMLKRNGGGLVPLALVSGWLAELTAEPPPGYGRVLKAALDGVLPARRIGGRWFIAEADLMAAAVVLGMAAPAEPAPRHEAERLARPRSDREDGAPAAKCAAVPATAAPLGPAGDGEGARRAPRRSVRIDKAPGDGRRVTG